MLRDNYNKEVIEAGCDEAGRGCLAGPVYAAAVILPPGFKHKLINDSKKLSASQRYSLREVVEKEALAWSVAIATHEEIDRINILNASFLAMHRAIHQLKVRPELLLIDGNRFRKYPSIDHKCIIDGDATFISIAAASILAKTYRDEYMEKLHASHPEYDWQSNKGYGTSRHRQAIRQFGFSPFHRRSFHLKEAQTAIEF